MGRKWVSGHRSAGCALEAMESRTLLSTSWADGTANAMAYDSTNDKTWVVYYDAAQQKAKVASRVGSGAWQSYDIPNNGASPGYDINYGSYVSIALDQNNLPGIAYYDSANADLKYTHYDAFNDRFDAATTVVSTNNSGQYPSIDYSRASGSSELMITYFYDNSDSLKYARWSGSSWSFGAVDWDRNVGDSLVEIYGRYSSVKYNPGTGRWSVAYDRTASGSVTGQCRYSEYQSTGAWSTTPTEIYSGGTGGGYNSLSFNGNDPAIAFYDAAAARLRYVRKTGSNPWPSSTAISPSGTTIGLYNTLYFKSNKAQIVTYKKTASKFSLLKYAESATPSVFGAPATLFEGGISAGGGGNSAAENNTGDILFTLIDAASDTLQLRSTAEFSYGRDFDQATDDAHTRFSSRMSPGTATFQGKMWVFGGNSGSSALGDMWNSTDGQTWTQQTLSGDIPVARHNPRLVVSSDGATMWIIGGDGAPDVYKSTDGLAWTRMDNGSGTLPAGLDGYAAIYFNGALYVLGGYDTSGVKNTVYRSTDDGATWTQLSQTSGFTPVYDLAAVVFNNEMWILGGKPNLNNAGGSGTVWRSTNGQSWTSASGSIGARWGHAAVVADMRIWVMGGSSGGSSKRDVYYSLDGIDWTLSADPADFSARFYFGALNYNGKLWALGGSSGGNEVWLSA